MSAFVNSGGTRIFYQVQGTGDPLVLIMGFGADGNMWEKHLESYRRHFKCIVIDNRGVGQSDQPSGPYSTKLMAEDVISVMDDAGVRESYIAGISMGGAIAQQVTLNHPKRVKALALISTWPKFNTYAKTVYENLKKLRLTSKPEEFMELLQLWIFAAPYYEIGLGELKADQEAARINPKPQTKAGFEGQLDACIHHDVVDRLHEIDIPTLITVGAQDIFTPPAFSEQLHQLIKGSRLVTFPDGGHVHHWEDLQRFNQVTTEFFKSMS